MKGNGIIVSSNPLGRFLEGIASGALKPGTCVEQTSAASVSGRFTYQNVTRSTGTKGPIFVVLPDWEQGGLNTTVYTTGNRCFVYAPIAGEELNMLVASGQAASVADLFGVLVTSGKLTANSAFASAPFQAMEAFTSLASDTLEWFTYLGNQA